MEPLEALIKIYDERVKEKDDDDPDKVTDKMTVHYLRELQALYVKGYYLK